MPEDNTKAETRRRRLILSLQDAPVRICYTVHHCELCEERISHGQAYADRGYDRRAHYDCVPGLGARLELWMREGKP